MLIPRLTIEAADAGGVQTAMERAEKSIAWLDPDPEYSVNGGRFRTGKACGGRLKADEAVEEEVDEGEEDGTEGGGEDAVDAEAGDEGGGDLEHEAVDEEVDEAEGQDDEGEKDDLEEESEDGAGEADYGGSDEGGDKSIHLNAGEDAGDDEEGDGFENPVQEPVAHMVSMIAEDRVLIGDTGSAVAEVLRRRRAGPGWE
jgi:hypothetical protein